MATTKAKSEIARRDPFEEMREMMEEWAPFRWGWNHFWPTWPARPTAGMFGDPLIFRGDWIPAMDVVEEEKATVVRMELPGVDPEKVAVRVEEGFLIVEGERERETVEGNGEIRRRERRWGKFCRSVSLPEGANADKITAEYDKGVLTVRIPRPEVKVATGKKIEIKMAASPDR